MIVNFPSSGHHFIRFYLLSSYSLPVNPEEQRLKELTEAVQQGLATEAEKEELALYAEQHPHLYALVRRVGNEREVGGQWLARAEADRRLDAKEKTPLALLERQVGVSLVIAGGALGFFFPPAFFAMLFGMSLLLWSVLRVKISTHGQDPYDDVEL